MSVLWMQRAGSGLDRPRAMVFGPDGNLYVASRTSGNVLRFDGASGDFIDEVISNGTAALDDPWGLTFDNSGHLYVSRVAGNEVLRFDAATFAFVDRLAIGTSGTLSHPTSLAMSPGGDLLIANQVSYEIRSYSAGVTVSLSAPSNQVITTDYTTADGTATSSDYSPIGGTLTFAPGETSKKILLTAKDDLDVESDETFSVLLSNPTGDATIDDGTAAVTIMDEDASRQIAIDNVTITEGDDALHFKGMFVQARSGGLNGANSMVYGPDGNLYVVSLNTGEVLRYDGFTGAVHGRFCSAVDWWSEWST